MAQIQMTLGWVIAYVESPAKTAEFYADTFGLKTEFVAGDEYAQMDTGSTKLGFASYTLGQSNFPGGVRRAEGQPFNVELALVHEDVDAAFKIAVDAG
jgi:lactoylglutathione lyase